MLSVRRMPRRRCTNVSMSSSLQGDEHLRRVDQPVSRSIVTLSRGSFPDERQRRPHRRLTPPAPCDLSPRMRSPRSSPSGPWGPRAPTASRSRSCSSSPSPSGARTGDLARPVRERPVRFARPGEAIWLHRPYRVASSSSRSRAERGRRRGAGRRGTPGWNQAMYRPWPGDRLRPRLRPPAALPRGLRRRLLPDLYASFDGAGPYVSYPNAASAASSSPTSNGVPTLRFLPRPAPPRPSRPPG